MRELNSSLLVPPLLLTSLWPLPLLLLLVRTSHARTPLQPPAAKMVPKDAAAPKWQSGHSTVTTPWLVELPDPGVRTSITYRTAKPACSRSSAYCDTHDLLLRQWCMARQVVLCICMF
jgi:hypothetical protein